ncbi:MAG: DUF1127 domain-containing protein [Kiloniellales bacterium]|nr:DUF1127 domain-containing protein [Kiloniellales bacterium]
MFDDHRISSDGTAIASPRSPLQRRLGARLWLLRFFDRLIEWQTRYQERQRLRQLDDRILRDIGLTRADIEFECSKPVWRP